MAALVVKGIPAARAAIALYQSLKTVLHDVSACDDDSHGDDLAVMDDTAE